MALEPELVARFAGLVGPGNAVTDPDRLAPHLVEWRGLYRGRTSLMLQPETAAEVSAIMALAGRTRTAIVPQGGNTGLVGGQIPDGSGGQIILSLSRMDAIRNVDAAGGIITVEAGATLQAVQDTADAADRLFPLSLASQASAQIGGVLSTNAGGTTALAFGVARDLCLGLEVVLASGEILHGLRSLKKDNRGYDLRNLFIGAEGTLGIITAASLKLFPKPRGTATAFAGLASPARALELLTLAQSRLGASLTSFELSAALPFQFALRHMPALRDPFARSYPWYVLLEASSPVGAAQAQSALAAVLEDALAAELIGDAVPAASDAQARAFWAIREGMSEAQKHEGGSIKHDISLPLAAIPQFMDEAALAVQSVVPGARIACFGHLGDGNLHYNVSQPVGADKASFLARWADMNDAVHAVVSRHGGSFSAEHGIGVLKRDILARSLDPVALATMRSLKNLLDPLGILNPGKVL
jgi:FAD/FMN-containing dehydrogenase